MGKKVMVAVGLTDECLKSLEGLKGNPLISDAEITLYHVFRTEVMVNELVPYPYPGPDDYDSIEKSVKDILTKLGETITPEGSSFKTKVDFHSDPKMKFTEFANEQDMNLICVATRGLSGLKGLFSSSFADYLNKHASSDIYVIR